MQAASIETPQISRGSALELLTEYTKSESLIRHALTVEAALSWYAKHFSEDEELWGICGLLHDFDYERYPEPTASGHPFVGCKKLQELNYPEILIEAILGHANYSGVPRVSLLSKVLFACDELSGLITAAVLVRPDKDINQLTTESVLKKLKDKTFAKGVNRDDVVNGALELGIDLKEHIANVIEGIKVIAKDIGLSK